jgi:HPt (histidine-containing phosphotransfer) domain-containing protein
MPTIDNTSDNSLHKRLQELVQETDFDFVVELIDIFLQETPTQIHAIAKAIETKDSHSLSIAAHTLKGSSLNLGAKQLGAACFKLEELGHSVTPILESADIKEIQREFELAKAILSTYKQSKQ